MPLNAISDGQLEQKEKREREPCSRLIFHISYSARVIVACMRRAEHVVAAEMGDGVGGGSGCTQGSAGALFWGLVVLWTTRR